MAKSRAIDITGQTFGHLTVTDRMPVEPGLRKAAMWRCACQCGRETVAAGTSLRKGQTTSCGCRGGQIRVRKDGQPAKVRLTAEEKQAATTEASRWIVEESDGATFLLRRIVGSREAVVEHDGTRWVCSECGPQQVAGSATEQCPHVVVVGRNLPTSLALTLVSKVANTDRAKPAADPGKAKPEKRKSQAEILAAGERARTERAKEHDKAFVPATPVVVRQMTDEDRAKLEAARARRARTFQTPERSVRFVG